MSPGCGSGSRLKPLPGSARPQLEGGSSRLARVLQSRLCDQSLERARRHAAHGPFLDGELGHRVDAGLLELLHLALADVGHGEEAVLGLPELSAVVAPAAQTAVLQGTGRVGFGASTNCSRRLRAARA